MTKKQLFTAWLAMAALALAACGDAKVPSGSAGNGGSAGAGAGGSGGNGGTGGTEAPAFHVGVEPHPDEECMACGELAPGQSRRFVATVLSNADASPIGGKQATWSVDDEAVATIDDEGTVIAVAEGETLIRATVEGVEGSYRIEVATPSIHHIVTGSSAQANRPGIVVGQRLSLWASAYRDLSMPLEEDPQITWASSNESVATVEGGPFAELTTTAELVAVAPGLVTIEAKSALGGEPGVIEVEVIDGELGAPAARFDDLQMGIDATCASAAEATYCWGSNATGQLGLGIAGGEEFRPTPTVTAPAFRTLDVGFGTACGIDEADGAWCWGSNSQRALGVGSAEETVPTPTAVVGGHAFESIALGHERACAVEAGGTAWCWGRNLGGTLGVGSSEEVIAEPTRVAGAVSFAQLALSMGFTCGLDLEGKAFCWGEAGPQLGTGGTGFDPVTEPTAVAGDRRFVTIGAGWRHVCAVDDVGAVWCWGLLNVDPAKAVMLENAVPTQVELPSKAVGLAVGNDHACALVEDGSAWCWGNNAAGQLGTGGYEGSITPSPVYGDLHFDRIRAGGATTCGLATDGAAWCWGDGAFGSLGAGREITNRTIPVAVSFPVVD